MFSDTTLLMISGVGPMTPSSPRFVVVTIERNYGPRDEFTTVEYKAAATAETYDWALHLAERFYDEERGIRIVDRMPGTPCPAVPFIDGDELPF